MTGSGPSGGSLGGAAFSAVVVLHDSAGPLAALLASFGRLPVPPQLVVVDTGSADEGL